MSVTIPPGLESTSFKGAIAAFIDALGPEGVITDPTALLEFRDPYAFRESDEFDAAAAVLPTSTEQVQAVVRIANEHGVPLWVFSQGRNNTYGGPAPRLRGSVIVNLRNMNRVLEINEDLAYAVVEPGVRWQDLADALLDNGAGLWTSIPDLGWGSVVGNSLEYGIGYSPGGDHAANICGLEVVLPDGSVLRTGMGGMTANDSWHAYPHSFGPSLAGLFQQSNLGIVTRVGWWVMPRPEAYSACWARFSGYDALAQVVDTLRPFMLDNTVTNKPMIARGFDMGDDGAPFMSQDPNGWVARFALYGPTTIVDAQYDIVSSALSAIAGVEVSRRQFEGTDIETQRNHDERVQRGVPDMDLLNPDFLPYGADTAHLDFSPVGPATGEAVVRTERLINELYAAHGHMYVNAVYLNARSALHVSTTFFDPRDADETAGVYAGYRDLVEKVAATGDAPYRTNLQHMDQVAALFDFGDHAQLRVNQVLKDALDPNGILAPGKSGIWPRHLRTD